MLPLSDKAFVYEIAAASSSAQRRSRRAKRRLWSVQRADYLIHELRQLGNFASRVNRA